jgi:hypothetical protein
LSSCPPSSPHHSPCGREGRQDRKRKAALEQGNILKKIKKRTYM